MDADGLVEFMDARLEEERAEADDAAAWAAGLGFPEHSREAELAASGASGVRELIGSYRSGAMDSRLVPSFLQGLGGLARRYRDHPDFHAEWLAS